MGHSDGIERSWDVREYPTHEGQQTDTPAQLHGCDGRADEPSCLSHIRIEGNITLPPDRYSGTVAWKEAASRKGVERSRKRYKIELPAGDVVRWGGDPVTGWAMCLIDISAEVAAGGIPTL